MTVQHSLAELQELLRRADLLRGGERTNVYTIPNGGLRIEFAARIAIRSEQHSKPAGVDFSDADIELLLELEGGEDFDAIRACSAQVVIEGLDSKSELYKFALHFDRHDHKESSTDLHAQYHWQVGGDKLEGQQYGTVLQLQSPRFPYHPLDPILLVDFVLGHFNGLKRKSLMQDAAFVRYPRILYKSQTSFVAPFFSFIHQSLNTEPAVSCILWPGLCGSDH